MNVRQPTIAVTYAQQQPFAVLEKRIATHHAFFKGALEIVPLAALLSLAVAAVCRIAEILYFLEVFSENHPMFLSAY